MKPQPKKTILEFLKNVYPEWRSGASLESYNFGGKPSTTGRTLRKLHKEGKLEHKYEMLQNRADEQVFYRFLPQESPKTAPRGIEMCIKGIVDEKAEGLSMAHYNASPQMPLL